MTAAEDVGYVATHTLAGSRLNTALRDTPAAISIFTKEFLEDIGAINVNEALEYGMNAATDITDYTGNTPTSTDLVIQMRGFTGASQGRNYFQLFAIGLDGYNVERIDFARGPNSILFGVGGPGGIINASTKRARIGGTITELQLRAASYDDYRFTADFGRTLIPQKLAARVNLLYQDRDGYREFEQREQIAAAMAMTWRPFKNTELRVEGERQDVDQVIAHPFPAQERYQSWVNNGSQISETYGQARPGAGANNSRLIVYDPFSGMGPISWFGSRGSNSGGVAPSLGNNTAAITDESILPKRANVSGPGTFADYTYEVLALFVEQRIGSLSMEAAYQKQWFERRTHRPQGFASVALRLDPNAILPTGAPNPNVGQFFTDGTMTFGIAKNEVDDYRFTAAYEMDLSRRHEWLGRHQLAVLLTRRDNQNFGDGFAEVNVTPAGTSIYPLDLTAANNQIMRRTYLDFSSSDPNKRGLHSWKQYPLTGENGVTSGFIRRTDASRNDLTRNDSQMIAIQSVLFDRRLILTGGYRKDEVRNWGSTSDLDGDGSNANDRDPVTREFPKRIRLSESNDSKGNTRTFGIVYHLSDAVSLFYNNANNFIPQSDLDIFEQRLGNRKGEGMDAGVRLNLFEGRVRGSMAFYRTDEINRAVGRDNAFINQINAIWDTLGMQERSVFASSRDGNDTTGEGWEMDWTANPTRNLRLSINWSNTEQVADNIQPRNGLYVAQNRDIWQANADIPLTILGGLPAIDGTTGEPATIGTAIRSIDGLYAGSQQAAGQQRRQLREYGANFFARYSFDSGPRYINGLFLGAGANYRGNAVLGYDSTRNNEPILGGKYVLVNAMAGYTFRLENKHRLRVQLNVNNVLDKDDWIVTDADQNRVWRVSHMRPRNWSLSGTYTF